MAKRLNGVYRLRANDPRRRLACQNPGALTFDAAGMSNIAPCTTVGVAYIDFDFRFGKTPDEPVLVDVETLLCAECGQAYWECEQEGRAEARMS